MKLCLASGNAHKAREFQQLADAGVLRGALQVVSAREACGGMPGVVEDTGTFVGNARKKARALHEKLRASSYGVRDFSPAFDSGIHPAATAKGGQINLPVKSGTEVPHSIKGAAGFWVMSDDSGLCVDALNGEPGVESAYYAGPQGDGAANLAKLVRVMRDVRDVPDMPATSNAPATPDAPDENRARAAHFVCVLVLISPSGEEHVFEGRCDGHLAREPRGGGGFGYDPLFVPDGFEKTFAELGEAEKNDLSHRARAWRQAEAFLKRMT